LIKLQKGTGAVHTMCFRLLAGKQSGNQYSNTEKSVIVLCECFGNLFLYEFRMFFFLLKLVANRELDIQYVARCVLSVLTFTP
jgi:hypothetical protein